MDGPTTPERLPADQAPRYLLHDHDAAFTDVVSTIAAMQIHELVTAPRSPWQNAYVEHLTGSIRRECLDHVIVLSVAGLQRVLADDVACYMNTRTHLSLHKDAPASRPATRCLPDVSSRFQRSTGCITATATRRRSDGSKGPVVLLLLRPFADCLGVCRRVDTDGRCFSPGLMRPVCTTAPTPTCDQRH
jgi:hypothetical protein